MNLCFDCCSWRVQACDSLKTKLGITTVATLSRALLQHNTHGFQWVSVDFKSMMSMMFHQPVSFKVIRYSKYSWFLCNEPLIQRAVLNLFNASWCQCTEDIVQGSLERLPPSCQSCCRDDTRLVATDLTTSQTPPCIATAGPMGRFASVAFEAPNFAADTSGMSEAKIQKRLPAINNAERSCFDAFEIFPDQPLLFGISIHKRRLVREVYFVLLQCPFAC